MNIILNNQNQFLITQYPFPNTPSSAKKQFYKTIYQCQSFEISNTKLSQLTSLNRLPSLIKLKEIKKSMLKYENNGLKIQKSPLISSYTLYYEIIPHFILSQKGIQILKTFKKVEIKKIFQNMIRDIEYLIENRIFYVLDVKNMAITQAGQIKFYLPATNIFENEVFTDHHKNEMKINANIVINYLLKNLQNLTFSNKEINVDQVRIEIQMEVRNLQNNCNNVESQIFTFNQKLQKQDQNDLQAQKNNDSQKTVKKRRSCEPFQTASKFETGTLLKTVRMKNRKIQSNIFITQKLSQNQQEYNFCSDEKKLLQKSNKNLVNHKDEIQRQNELLKEKMREYEEKLQKLSQNMMRMRQQLNVIQQHGQNKPKLRKFAHDKMRSKTYANLQLLDRCENMDQVHQKLSKSRIEIKKLFFDDRNLAQSYHLEGADSQDELEKQFQRLFKFETPQEVEKFQFQNKMMKRTFTEQKQYGNPNQWLANRQRLDEIKEEQISQKYLQKVNHKPSQKTQISVNNEHEELPLNPKTTHRNRKINLLPIASLQKHFRYSSLVLQKDFNDSFGCMPQNINDPTQYDSIDTMQMELERQMNMPKMTSKDAVRHTLFPSKFIQRAKSLKNAKKIDEQAIIESQLPHRRSRKIHQSAADYKVYNKCHKSNWSHQQDFTFSESLSGSLTSKDMQNCAKVVITESLEDDINSRNQSPAKREQQMINYVNQPCHGLLRNTEYRPSQQQKICDYERVSKTNKYPSNSIYLKHQQNQQYAKRFYELKGSNGNQKTNLNKQKIKAVLLKSKCILQKYKNLSLKKK